MKLFRSMLEFYQICGISQLQPNRRLNTRIVVFLLFIFWFFISLIGTFLYKLTTIGEHIDLFCLLITVAACSANILECVWKRSEVFGFIKRMEQLIEKSKTKLEPQSQIKSRFFFYLRTGSNDLTRKIMDMELNDKIEWISRWIYFLQVKVTIAAFVLPAVLITLINYFVLDKKDRSYFLPIPIMYV